MTTLSFGQVINEVDADTPGTDTAEFIEIKHTPNTALDGLVVVLYNGSNDSSYAAYDLDGKSTDANGLFILANTALATASDIDLGTSNKIQNGADAVAIYTGNASDFPNGTAATSTNLLSGVVYDTADADDTGLLAVSGGVQYNEKENASSVTQSVQRKADGTYELRVTSDTRAKEYGCFRLSSKCGTRFTSKRIRELPRGQLGAWDDKMTCYPIRLDTSHGESYLFYNGNEMGRTGVGFASLKE